MSSSENKEAVGQKRKAEEAENGGGDASRAKKNPVENAPFQLHERLDADCVLVKDLVLCRVLLLNDGNYPWCILVPRQNGITESYQLSRADQHILQDEIAMVSEALHSLEAKAIGDLPWRKPTKINVAALGNMVPQLHVHVIGRNPEDAAWPGPVWGKVPAKPYSEAQLATALRLLDRIVRPVIHESEKDEQ